MVKLQESDRDSSRFSWPSNPLDPNSDINVYRFTVVFFGAACSQFLLNVSLKIHLDNSIIPCAAELSKSLYVDNVDYSCEDESSLIDFYGSSVPLSREAGFTLREWTSNSTPLNDIIRQNGGGLFDNSEYIDALGLRWNREGRVIH